MSFIESRRQTLTLKNWWELNQFHFQYICDNRLSARARSLTNLRSIMQVLRPLTVLQFLTWEIFIGARLENYARVASGFISGFPPWTNTRVISCVSMAASRIRSSRSCDTSRTAESDDDKGDGRRQRKRNRDEKDAIVVARRIKKRQHGRECDTFWSLCDKASADLRDARVGASGTRRDGTRFALRSFVHADSGWVH